MEVQSKKFADIAQMTFLENVDEFMKKSPGAEEVIQQLQQQYSLYKMKEQSLTRRKTDLKTKLPEISSTLQAVQELQKKSNDTFITDFELAETMWAKAKIENPKNVCLWLGANVMVEFSFQEAIDLLSKNKESAEQSLISTTEQLDYLKDQITTTEVNIARVYNWDVKQRRKLRQQQQQTK